jgi:ABC-type branched-subunit amino acid transport system substrate-binding protein
MSARRGRFGIRARAVAAGLALGLCAVSAWAGDASGAPGPKTIVLGQSAAFSQSTRDTETWLGEMACFDQVNAAGGVQGRTISLLAADDGGDPEEVLANTVRLVDMDGVYALFGYSGGPALGAALPMLHKYSRDHLVLFSNYSGNELQRTPSALECVLNVRASYRRETESIVQLLSQPLGFRKFGILVQGDPQCRAVAAMAHAALAAHGLSPTVQVECQAPGGDAGAGSGADVWADQVGTLRDAGVQVVLVLAEAPACAAFISAARRAGLMVPVAVESLADTDQLLDSLDAEGQGKALSLTARLLSSQVVPSWSDLSFPLVRDYRQAMDQAKTRLPGDLKAKTRKGAKYGFASLEGYLNARLLAAVLAKTQKGLLRKDFYLMAITGQPWDVGLFTRADFRDKRPQALNSVYMLVVKDNAWVPLADPGSLK